MQLLVKSLSFFLFLILLLSCSKQTDFTYKVFKNGAQEINLQLPDYRNYLIYDETVPVLIEWKNIDRSKSAVTGSGIKLVGSKDETMITTFTPQKQYIKTDSLSVFFRFEIDGEIHNASIKIPLKDF